MNEGVSVPRAWVLALAALAMLISLIAPLRAAETDLIGGDVVRQSAMGPDDRVGSSAFLVDVAYDQSRGQRHLIVWTGATDPDRPDDVDVFARITEPDGTEPFQVSDLGGDGPTFSTAIATIYNPGRGEYLVVWAGAAGNVNPSFDIWAQRVSAVDGALVGAPTQVSSLADPILIIGLSVAYNAVDNQYLVVWAGIDDDPEAPLERFEDEVYGQLLDADGQEVGPDDFRISRILGDGDTGSVEVFTVDAAYNSIAGTYLVVWDGLAYLGDEVLLNDLEIEQYAIDQEYEIFGSQVSAEGIVGEEFLISTDELPGPPAAALPLEIASADIDTVLPDRSSARDPVVAFNEVSNDFLVAWRDSGSDHGLGRHEFEIFGRIVSGGNSRGTGGGVFQISDHGPSGDPAFQTSGPAVAVDDTRGEHLVVWAASDPGGAGDAFGEGPSLLDEGELFGQLLAVDGTLLAGNQQLTEVGEPGDGSVEVVRGTVAPAGLGQYLAVWIGNAAGMASEDVAGTTRHDTEVFTGSISLDIPEPAPVTTAVSDEPPPTVTPTTTVIATGATTAPASGGDSSALVIALVAAVVLAGGGAIFVSRRGR